jgi:predicted PurR-regulated permease PerM
MTIVVRNPVYRVIALVLTLAIVAILYFAVIKPNNDNANNAVNNAVKTTQQLEKQAAQQVNQANQAAKSSGGAAIPAGVTNLVNCIAAAGTNVSEIQACKAKFQP